VNSTDALRGLGSYAASRKFIEAALWVGRYAEVLVVK